MNKIIFTFMIINLNTIEHPIYKATCINGFGHGCGNSVDEAVDECRRQVANMVDICNKLHISNDMINKEQFMDKTESWIYGATSWENSSVQWIELEYDQLMQTEIEHG